MKKIIVLIMSTCICALILYMYLHKDKVLVANENHTVYLKKDSTNFKLFRNGKHFKMRGATGKTQLKSLAAIGGNTIRVYDTINIKSVLDDAHHNKLAVIVEIPIPKNSNNYNFYASEENTIQLKNDVKKFVRKYKNHPALLLWNLGNELDYPLTINKNSFINTFNNLIDIIHQEDRNHLVSTTLIPSLSQTLGIHLHSSKIDLLGFNAFGNLKRINPLIKKVSYISTTLPYFIAEYGINGPWEEKMTPWQVPIEQTSTKKAEQYTNTYNNFVENNENSLGDLVFYWGQKQEHTHTWFSIFDEHGRKSEVFYAIKSYWGNTTSKQELPPQIKYLLIDGKGANDKLVFSTNTQKNIEVLLETQSPKDSTFVYKWEVYAEGWDYNQTEKEDKPKKILETDAVLNKKTLAFSVPQKEGAYRVFVYIYDDKGNFSTSNIPFYALKK